MRHKLSMVGFALLLLLTFNFNFAQDTSKKEFKIVVIGVVLDTNTQQPEEGAIIELHDLISKEKESFTTKQDGNFYFQLEADKKYTLSKLNPVGDVVEQKDIMTVGKGENTAEILNIMFGAGYESVELSSPATDDND